MDVDADWDVVAVRNGPSEGVLGRYCLSLRQKLRMRMSCSLRGRTGKSRRGSWSEGRGGEEIKEDKRYGSWNVINRC